MKQRIFNLLFEACFIAFCFALMTLAAGIILGL